MNKAIITVPIVSLPNGGSGIQNISQKFTPNIFTGGGEYNYSFPLTSARTLTPKLTLTYSTGFGNGNFGQGFDMRDTIITRKTHQGVPLYNDEDTFIWGGEDLVRLGSRNSENWIVTDFKPRVERAFASIEYWKNTDNLNFNAYWVVRTKDGVNHIYGQSQNARVANPDDPSQIFTWLIQESCDEKGNRILYDYYNENTQIGDEKQRFVFYALREIKYGNYHISDGSGEKFAFRVLFDYTMQSDPILESLNQRGIDLRYQDLTKNRQDNLLNFKSGFGILTNHLCQHVLMLHQFDSEFNGEEFLVGYWSFVYTNQVSNCKPMTFLSSIQYTGCRFMADKQQYITRSEPPQSFTYQPFNLSSDKHMKRLRNTLAFQKDYPLDVSKIQFVDLYREGLPGILYSDEYTSLYWRNLGKGKYAASVRLASLPIQRNVGSSKYHLVDIEANNSLCMMVVSNNFAGYYKLSPDLEWTNYTEFPKYPTEYTSQFAELVDLEGDGKPDLVIFDPHYPRYYENLGIKGFSTPKPIRVGDTNQLDDLPVGYVNDQRVLTTFANIFGDGMAHRVRVSNGKIEVWPNLGNGIFGNKMTLPHAPKFEVKDRDFHANTLQFVNIDGSGLDDLIYIQPDKITIYTNLGIGFSEKGIDITFPEGMIFSTLDKIEFIDILGQGTPSMVFIKNDFKPEYYYFNISGSTQPYLLNSIENGLGSTTTLEYTSSAEQYLIDIQEQPRKTQSRLPFPKIVVKSIQTKDFITGLKVTNSFRYHDGYYDPVEREFNGFGYIEHFDGDIWDDSKKEIVSDDFHSTPVLTKIWYHTGAQHVNNDQYHISMQYSDEYYQGDKNAYSMADSVLLPENTNKFSNYIDICYTMQGSILRQEVFGLGKEYKQYLKKGTGDLCPYTVNQNNFTIKQIQDSDNNSPGIYTLLPRESITFEYNSNPDDPAVHHQFELEHDLYNNVLKEVVVSYPRRIDVDLNLQTILKLCKVENETLSKVNDKQKKSDMLITFSTYGNLKRSGSVDRGGKVVFNYLGNLLSSVLYGVNYGKLLLNNQIGYLSFDIVAKQVNQLVNPKSNLQQTAYFYCDNGQESVAVNFSAIQGIPLLHHTEQMVISEKTAQSVYGNTFGDLYNILQTDCGFIKNGDVWVQPNQVIYYDKKNYFVSSGLSSYNIFDSSNPLWQKADIIYDPYYLTVVSVDRYMNGKKVGKNPKTEIDYHLIKPNQITDVNNITAEVIYDPLGVVVVTALHGQFKGQAQGHSLQEKDKLLRQLMSVTSLEQAIMVSETLVANASSLVFYSQSEYNQNKLANWNFTFSHQTVEQPSESFKSVSIPHESIGKTVQYYDGLGNLIQTKMLVDSDRWVVSGFQIYNEKGLVVHQYLPFWSTEKDGYVYESEKDYEKSTLPPPTRNFYDAMDRLIRVKNPDESFRVVVITPWCSVHYDENDNDIASPFHLTPQIKLYDVLGHEIASVEILIDEENRNPRLLVTNFDYDLLKRLISERDPRLKQDNIQYLYNNLGQKIQSDSVDRGLEVTLYDRDGKLRYYHDGRYITKQSYDQWKRMITVVSGKLTEEKFTTIQRFEYGTELQLGTNANEKLIKKYDQAGLAEYQAYNIRGQCIQHSRKIYQPQSIINSNGFTDVMSDNIDHLLNQESTFTIEKYYNIFGLIIGKKYPDNSIEVNTYNAANQLTQVNLYKTDGSYKPIVKDIQYNEVGQVKAKTFSDKLITERGYEPKTLRLSTIVTLLNQHKYQDIQYQFDKTGNVIGMSDSTLNQLLSTATGDSNPVFNYKYDSLYRVRFATARQIKNPTVSKKEGGDLTNIYKTGLGFFAKSTGRVSTEDFQLINAEERFEFDDGDNLQSKKLLQEIQPLQQNDILISSNSNRVRSISTKGNVNLNLIPHYDVSGNMERGISDMTSEYSWSYNNQLTTISAEGGVKEYHRYTSVTNRMVTLSISGSILTETVYLDSYISISTYIGSNLTTNKVLVNIGDHQQQVATYSYFAIGENKGEQLIFHLTNYINSVCLDVLEDGQVLNYEEYLAFGDTSFSIVAKEYEFLEKHYRYSSQDKNKTTGLYCYGARFYAPWVGRWISADPIGIKDTINENEFVHDRPLSAIDVDGLSFHWLFEKKGVLKKRYKTTKKTKNVSVLQKEIDDKDIIIHPINKVDASTKEEANKTIDILNENNAIFEILNSSSLYATTKEWILKTKDTQAFKDKLKEYMLLDTTKDSTTHYVAASEFLVDASSTQSLYLISSGGLTGTQAALAQSHAHTEAFAIPFKPFEIMRGIIDPCNKCGPKMQNSKQVKEYITANKSYSYK